MPTCFLLALSLALGAEPPKVDRSIGKEPKYAGKPRYALLLIGKEQKRVWLAQDGDLLYVDTNGDGDLADEKPVKGERSRVTRHEADWDRVVFEVALPGKLGLHYESYDDPKINDYLFLYTDVTNPPFPRDKIHQGASGDASGDFRFTEKPEDCPVFRFLAPLTMRPLGAKSIPLGEEEDLTVRVGTHGLGKGSFVSLETDRVPGDVHPKAEIVFPGKKRDDPPVKLTVPLKQRC
jgi:hypothetical protein